MAEPPASERPKWSITWLLRIQRVERNRPRGRQSPMQGGRWLPWVVLGALLVEVAVLVWLGVLPR